jgi:Pheromone A receptor
MHRELPSVAFVAATLVLIPFPWHWRVGNVATLSIIAWLFVTNVIYGVDALIWADNVNVVIPVWCDISEYHPLVFHCDLFTYRSPQQQARLSLVPTSLSLPPVFVSVSIWNNWLQYGK